MYLTLSWAKGVVVEGLAACMPKFEQGSPANFVIMKEPALRSCESVREMMLGDPPPAAVKSKVISRLSCLAFSLFEP